MKIAISSMENNEHSKVSDRFARSEYFIIYDHDSLSFTSVENTAKSAGSGAGGKAVKILGDLGVEVVLVPELGPKALEALQAFEIKSFQYPREKTVREVLYLYFEKKLPELFNSTSKGRH
ncbi:MAG: NifB/NifX family molybdenum-iron cluster-binding protein [Candidatus Izimaplasma sp.]|nr:NifB/NifX family molybdenum-iron cluster-binding protein [Candidatus Izimaplasma bacterium]